MAARVIHFGLDDCYRVPVLRAAGFEVREAKSLDELSVDLQRDDHVGAVIVSEDIEPTAEWAADVVRRAVLAPVILFRRSQQVIDERKFDKVYTCMTSPDIWLGEMAALIAKGYKLQADATASGQRRLRCRQSRNDNGSERTGCVKNGQLVLSGGGASRQKYGTVYGRIWYRPSKQFNQTTKPDRHGDHQAQG